MQGVRGALRWKKCLETGEEGRLYAACKGLSRGNMTPLMERCLVVFVAKLILTAGKGKNWRACRTKGGKKGATNGNVFEVEQAPGVADGFGWRDDTKVLTPDEHQASGPSPQGWHHLQV